MKFRKKPAAIEAVQYPGGGVISIESIPWWLIDAEEADVVRYDEDQDILTIHTLEGVHTASKGDWIIRGVKGELYPCKPDIFEATYEAVVEGAGHAAAIEGKA